mmetsp:Transcript_24093/g.44614  ORF Transcript_24093/g.44614 Transcript_24093/m.44614 type:complete len:431 (-) Transcript_24093:2837-4129(-)
MVVPGVVLDRHGRGIGELGDKVLAAQRDGINAQFARGLVHHTLQLEGRLGAACPTVCIDRHSVGKHRLHVHIDQRRLVVPGHQRAMQPCRHRRGKGRQVRAHIGMGVGAQCGKVIVRVQRQFDLGHVVTAMGVRHERLGPARRPFDRTVTGLGGKGAERFFLVMEDFCAEPATHIGGYNAQLVLGDAQHKRAHQQPDHMWVLRGGIKRMLIRAARIITHRNAGLHGVSHQTVVDQLQRGDVRGLVKGLVHRVLVFLNKAPIIAQVVGQIVMDLRRAVGQRGLHVHNGGQLGNIDVDRFGGVAGLLKRLGHNGGDRFAHVADLALGQHRVGRFLHRLAVFVGDLPAAGNGPHTFEIRAGKHLDHAGHGFGGAGVHRSQRPMRNVRAQEIHVRLSVNVDVIRIVADPCQKPYVLAALAAGADTSVFGHVIPP